jgi:hypothetical protein
LQRLALAVARPISGGPGLCSDRDEKKSSALLMVRRCRSVAVDAGGAARLAERLAALDLA